MARLLGEPRRAPVPRTSLSACESVSSSIRIVPPQHRRPTRPGSPSGRSSCPSPARAASTRAGGRARSRSTDRSEVNEPPPLRRAARSGAARADSGMPPRSTRASDSSCSRSCCSSSGSLIRVPAFCRLVSARASAQQSSSAARASALRSASARSSAVSAATHSSGSSGSRLIAMPPDLALAKALHALVRRRASW